MKALRHLAALLLLSTSALAAPIRILPIGDSITQGGKKDREEYTYRWPLFAMLKDAGVGFDFIGTRNQGLQPEATWPDYHGTPFDPDHEGYYGAKTASVRDKLRENLPKLPPPDFALIHLGTNDQNSEDYAATIVQPLEQIVAMLRERNPKVVVLVGQLAFNGGAALKIRPLVEEMAARLNRAESPVVTVHHYRGWKENPQTEGSDTFDWAHPNPQGQRKMAAAWFAAMRPFLPEAGAASTSAPTPSETWEWTAKADVFSPDALLDLRALNEKQSGEHGFIQLSADGNSFVRGDGEPIRFWAVGADGWALTPEEMDRQCRWLAKMGVNLVRLHFNAAAKAPKDGEPELPIEALNEKLIEGVLRYVKAAKENGIYLIISPYWAHHEMPANWAIDGFAPKQQLWGALFIDEKLQAAYRTWTRELYTRRNPHTGLAIKDDPTVAFLQVQNEDSLFFWTEGKMPEAQKLKLGRAFHAWCGKKYGSAEAALAAWGGGAKHKSDDAAGGVIGVHDIFLLTKPSEPAMAARLRDQTQFMAELQRAFYSAMGDHLRSLGCKQLLNASNWRTASDGTLKDIERWTYGALQWDAENRYSLDQHTGENAAWRVQAGQKFVSQSAIRNPLAIPTLMRQQEGHPFMVTENTWPSPNAYQAEMALLGAAYQSLTGVDGICWFAVGDEGWANDPTFPFWDLPGGKALRKFVVNQPHIAGMWPANALLFRRGDVREAEPVVRETRALESLWERRTPYVADHEYAGAEDELRRWQMPDGKLSRAAFLVGPVRWRTGDTAAQIGVFEDQVKDGAITSATGEVSIDPQRGIFRVAAPRAQGVAGFLREAGGRFKLPDAIIESQNEYAVIQLAALDTAPLSASRKVLAQVGTIARPTGWETKSVEVEGRKDGNKRSGEEVVATGAAPWRIVNSDAAITLGNPFLTKATRLDTNGCAAGDVPVTRAGETLRFTFPANAMWVVLE